MDKIQKQNWIVGVYIGTVGFIETAPTKEEAKRQAMAKVTDFIHTTCSHQAALQVLNITPFEKHRKGDGLLRSWFHEQVIYLLLRLERGNKKFVD
jgi:hypothetical protein